MGRHPWNRLIAWLIDWLCILVWVAVTAAVGVPLFLAGVTDGLGSGPLNLIATIVVVVPVTIAMARLESSSRQASVGKRARHLRVVDAGSGSRVPFRRTLTRNALKIALPWTLGHAVAYEIIRTGNGGPIPGWLWGATGAAYLIPAVFLVSLFVRRGRTPYDLATRTTVVP